MSEVSNENLAELNKRYRTTVYFVLAQVFVVSILIFAGWSGSLKLGISLSEQDFTTLWVGVLFIAIGSFILRRMFFSWERLKNIALLKGIPGVLGTLQRNAVILNAFAVFVAGFGFLIAAVSGNGSDMLRAGAIAFIVFLINFPRKKVWKTIVSNLGKV